MCGLLRSRWFRWLLVALWVLFIWSRSLFSGPESSAQSALVVAIVRPLFELLGISDQSLMTLIVRKLAHFSEYAVLGVLLALTCEVSEGRRRGGEGATTAAEGASPAAGDVRPWSPLSLFPQLIVGVVVPCADETIQLFVPGRAGQLTDVLIDLSGFALGFVITLFARRRTR